MSIRWTTAMLDLPPADLAATLAFWRDITGSGLSPWRGADEYATLVPPDGDDFLRVHRSTEGSRVHLDLHVGQHPASGAAARGTTPDEAPTAGAVRAELVRALALGAALEHDAGTHVVLSSPGGFVFCLVRDAGHARRPRPMLLDLAVRSTDPPASALVDQLCLDVPAPLLDVEVAFWSELTGWAAHTGSRAEFVVLERPDGMPLRLMLQRLGADDPRTTVTAHLDVATTARPAVVRAHVAAGARIVGHGPRWTTLADPSGRPYCLTDRDPATGRLPD